jgi:hypothetical protein
MIDSNYYDRFFKSFFVTTTSMFGAVIYPPLNNIEIVFVTFLMVSNCGLFGYTINMLGNIINELGKKYSEFKREDNIINCYMNVKNIDPDLQMRIKNYLKYQFKEKQDMNENEVAPIIEKLSLQLKDELKK